MTEFHPTVLRRNGTYDLMATVIAEHFGSFVDVRDRPAPDPQTLDRLPEVADSLGERFTDLLLVPRH